MNKLTKVGVSALCGSLAAVSAASAGDMTVTGGATATMTKHSGIVTGNPLGMASNLSFIGSGELDNGNTFTMTVAHNDQNAWSNSALSVDVAGIGTFVLDTGGGTGIDRLDDMMPSAKAETHNTGTSSGIVTVTGAGNGTDIEWTVDNAFLPEGMTARLSYNPRVDGGKPTDKGSTGAVTILNAAKGAGYDLVLEHSSLADGLNVFAGYSTVEISGSSSFSKDQEAMVLGGTYAVGAWTLGYQWSEDKHNEIGSTGYYENNAFGVTFAVNDDLTLSYGEHESERDTGSTSTTLKASSIQAAYSMGGATIAIADSSIDDANYTSGSTSDAMTVWLSLAF
jgi:outer membrane protein OmpU